MPDDQEIAAPHEEFRCLPVRDTVIYPGRFAAHHGGAADVSLALVQSLGENRTLAVISQRDPRVEEPGPANYTR